MTQDTIVGYIGGTAFCGSTLLSFLLNAQPGIASIGEVAWSIPKVNPGGYRCSCDEVLAHCSFWSEVSQEMKRRGHLFDAEHWNTAFDIAAPWIVRKLVVRPLGNTLVETFRDKLVRRVPSWERHLVDVGKQNAALFASIARVTGATAFVDASKDPIRVRYLRDYAAVEPRIIHLVRDSPAFVNSYIRRRNDLPSFLTAIRWWSATINRMERLRRVTAPEQWLVLRYEDLCANPEVELKRVLKFLGVTSSSPVLSFRSASHHIIGNTMRSFESSQIKLDSSWRSELSRTQLNQILKTTGRYRQLYGYS
jgi:hypothetical protein